MKLILLGAPGSGKGTQATYISQRYNLPHISTGEIFRENMKNNTELGIRVREAMDGGKLCPDDLTIELVKDRLNKPDCKNGYLLDGFPRNVCQAEALERFSSPDAVINLEVDLSIIERRLTGRRSCDKCDQTFHIDFIGNASKCPKCGEPLTIRKDDNPETVKERLTVYRTQTVPLVDYYTDKGKIISVNGNQDIKEVFNDIVKVLG